MLGRAFGIRLWVKSIIAVVTNAGTLNVSTM